MHGMVSLTLAERIEGGAPRARLLLHQGIEALLTSGIMQKSSG
jgi:hypothetical protein